MDQGTLFESVAAINTGQASVTVEGSPPQPIKFARVTPNIFDVLGVTMQRGRNFVAEDGAPQPPQPQLPPGQPVPAGPPPIRLANIGVLSHEFWVRQYGADPSLIGKNIEVFNQPMEVVGILPPGASDLPP